MKDKWLLQKEIPPAWQELYLSPKAFREHDQTSHDKQTRCQEQSQVCQLPDPPWGPEGTLHAGNATQGTA